LYAEIEALTNEDDSHRHISISDGTVSNCIMIAYRTNGNLNLYNNGTGSSESIYGDAGYDLTDNLKIAVKYGASKSDYRVYINGVQKTVRAGFTATSISGLNTLRFEQGGSGNKFYGKVRNVQVFTEALTDAELQELTS
jgi:hypothetical protein